MQAGNPQPDKTSRVTFRFQKSKNLQMGPAAATPQPGNPDHLVGDPVNRGPDAGYGSPRPWLADTATWTLSNSNFAIGPSCPDPEEPKNLSRFAA